MNNLTTNQTLNSKDIAEMTGMSHKEILKKLNGTYNPDGTVRQVGIIPTLTKGNFPLSDYFIESSYKDKTGKANKCYECTKMGCELLANKFTGEKGILFTAKYVKRFNEMSQPTGKKLLAMALIEANEVMEQQCEQITTLNTENDLLAEKQLTWTTRKTIESIIKKIGGTIGYYVAWHDFKEELYYKHRININSRHTNALKTCKNKSKVRKLDMIRDDELSKALSTATALARNSKVDISNLVDKSKFVFKENQVNIIEQIPININ